MTEPKPINEGHWVHQTAEYKMVAAYYGNRVAKRSSCRLMEHIDEGLMLLENWGVGIPLLRAWCLHPLMQDDRLYLEYIQYGSTMNEQATRIAVEYRAIANAYLPKHQSRLPDISAMDEVNTLLLVDKLHNRWQFENTCMRRPGIYPNEQRLRQYFHEWLEALSLNQSVAIAANKLWSQP